MTTQIANTAYAPLVPGAAAAPALNGFQANDAMESLATDSLKYATPEFSARVGGHEYPSIALNQIDIVILGWQAAGKVSRSFFESSNPVAGAKPICFSRNGDTPDSASTHPQAVNCSACRQNIAGSAVDKKGKACNFKVRLAVLLLNPAPPTETIFAFHLNAGSAFGDSGMEAQGLYSFSRLLRKLKDFPAYSVQQIAIRAIRKQGSQNNLNQLVFQILGVHSLPLDKYTTPEMANLRQYITSNEDSRASKAGALPAPTTAQPIIPPMPLPAPTPAPTVIPTVTTEPSATGRPDPFAGGFPAPSAGDASFGWD